MNEIYNPNPLIMFSQYFLLYLQALFCAIHYEITQETNE